MKPLELIATARRLTENDGPGPRRLSDLKRAVSTAYYPMFHALCATCANGFIGRSPAARSQPAWVQVYRSLEHTFAKRQCDNAVIKDFPPSVRTFAAHFVTLQDRWHATDFDPEARFKLTDVQSLVDSAEDAINGLDHCPWKHRRAFAARVTVRQRK